jgi:hypothetical protein
MGRGMMWREIRMGEERIEQDFLAEEMLPLPQAAQSQHGVSLVYIFFVG